MTLKMDSATRTSCSGRGRGVEVTTTPAQPPTQVPPQFQVEVVVKHVAPGTFSSLGDQRTRLQTVRFNYFWSALDVIVNQKQNGVRGKFKLFTPVAEQWRLHGPRAKMANVQTQDLRPWQPEMQLLLRPPQEAFTAFPIEKSE